MTTKVPLKTTYSVEKRFEAFFTGGAVELNRDVNRLYTTCGNVINVIDVESGAKITTIGSAESDDDVTYFCLRPSDDSVLVAYRNLLLKQYSVENVQQNENNIQQNETKTHVRNNRIWRSNHRAPIVLMGFSSDGRLLATGGSDSLVKIWDLELQYCVFTLRGAIGVITCLYFDEVSTSSRLFYGGDDGKILYWDLKSNTLSGTLDLHSGAGTVVLAEGDSIYTAGRDSVVGIWDRQALSLKKTLPIFDPVESMIVVSRNLGTSILITGGEKGILKSWDTKSSKCIGSSMAFGSVIKRIILPDKDQQDSIIAVTEDHVINFVNPTDLTVSKHFVGNNDEVLDAAFLNDYLLAVACNSNHIRVYNSSTGDCRLVTGHDDTVMCIDSATWQRSVFASGSKDNNMRIWRVGGQKVECIALATGHTNNVTGVKFSRKKAHFIASVSHDTTLKIWRLPASLIDPSVEHKEPERLVSAFTVAGHEKDVTCVDISPNDKLIATGSMDKSLKLWQVNSKTLTASLAGTITGHKRGVWDVCFSPVLQVIATASGDWTVKLFSLEDLSCVSTLEGHQTTALKVRFLPSGAQLFSTDSSGLLKLWNVKTGECTKTFDEHSKALWALELNEDGSKMLTGGGDSKIQLWRDATEEEKELELTKNAAAIADEQMLSNLVNQRNFTKALMLAIRLSRPFNVLKIIKNMTQQGQEEELSTALRGLSVENIGVLLDWVCEWNTNRQNCHVAQKVLTIILRQVTPQKLLKLPNIKDVVAALIPYSERHFDRLGRLRQQAAFSEYSWKCIRATGRADDDSVHEKAVKEEAPRE